MIQDFGARISGGPYRISECSVQDIPLSSWVAIFRKDFLLSKRLFFAEHFLHEDTDFNIRVFAYDPTVFFLPEQYYFYDNRRMNSITNSKGIQMQQDNLRILERFVSFSREVTIAPQLDASLFRYLFMVCVVSNYPLQFRFTSSALRMVKEYQRWIIETAVQGKYLPALIIASSLKCSVLLFVFSLRFFQYLALLRNKVDKRKYKNGKNN